MIIFSIAARELRSIFLSPLAWSMLAVVQLILGFMFISQVDGYLTAKTQLSAMQGPYGMTDILVAPLFGNAAIILLLAMPLVSMRLISEEYRNQTLSLLFSAPLSMTEIVLGKYLGILFFLIIMLGMISLMPLSLLMGGNLDLGMFASALLGLTLLLASFAAIGLFMSTLTTYPAVAAITTFGALLLLWIIDWMAGSGQGDSVLSYISMLRHFEPMLKGVFDTSDMLYFILFIITFVTLSIRRLDSYRLQH